MYKHYETNTIFYNFDQMRLWLVQNKNKAVSETQPNFNEVITAQGIVPYVIPEPEPVILTYKELRVMEYAPVQDQFDMQYWDRVNGTTTWRDHIASVKAKYPKK